MAITKLLRKLAGFDVAPAPVRTVPELRDAEKEWTALADQGRYLEAVNLCLSVVPDPKANFTASAFLGYAYHQLTQYDLAISYLEPALDKNGADYYSRFFLALSLRAVGRKQEAMRLFASCAQSHPDHIEEILDFAAPHADEVSREYQTALDRGGLSPGAADKLLFFLRRDAELRDRIGGRASLRSLRSVADWTAGGHGKLLSLGKPERIRIVHPPSNEKETALEISVDSNVPYVAEIPNATIVGGSSLVHVDDGIVLSDLLTDPRYGRFASLRHDKSVIAQRDDALLVNNFQPGEKISEGIMLSGLVSDAFGHWFAEFLPKLRHFESHPRFAELPIIVDEGMPRSHFDFLRALVDNPLRPVSRGAAVKVGTLLVAPATTFFPPDLFPGHPIPPEHQASWTVSGFRYIQDRIKRRFPVAGPGKDRIFLSRKKSSWRRLLNEEEILRELKPLGFKPVLLEELTFAEQVRTFQSAEAIVAPNGSVLNSLVFANHQVKVVVIGQQNHHNWGGWLGPMMDLGYAPVFLSGETIGDGESKHADYSLALGKFRKTIRRMLER